MELKIQRDEKTVCSMTLTKLKNGDIEIEYVQTDPSYRNKGLASSLLKKAIAIADRSKSNLVGFIEPDRTGGLTFQQEVEWLSRHGFVFQKKYDFGNYNFKPVMIYIPK